jgi:hypothetical protein
MRFVAPASSTHTPISRPASKCVSLRLRVRHTPLSQDQRQNAFRCACEFETHPYLKTSVKMRFVAPASSKHTPITRPASKCVSLRMRVRHTPLSQDQRQNAFRCACEFDTHPYPNKATGHGNHSPATSGHLLGSISATTSPWLPMTRIWRLTMGRPPTVSDDERGVHAMPGAERQIPCGVCIDIRQIPAAREHFSDRDHETFLKAATNVNARHTCLRID